MENESVKMLWKDYRTKNPDGPNEYEAWAFGVTKEMADELAQLVLEGKKTATASNYLLYELENEDLPHVGQMNIILDGAEKAVAVAETTFVEVVPFHEVTVEHAYLEGEGDRSLAYWRDVHESFFERELKEIGKEFHQDMLVVCEKFEVVYKK